KARSAHGVDRCRSAMRAVGENRQTCANNYPMRFGLLQKSLWQYFDAVKMPTILSLLLFGVLAWAQPMPASLVLGTWEGESLCQVPKPCTTEHVIYEIKD